MLTPHCIVGNESRNHKEEKKAQKTRATLSIGIKLPLYWSPVGSQPLYPLAYLVARLEHHQSGWCVCERLPHVRAQQVILTWQGRYHDQEGGSPRARLSHCTPVVLTPANSPNVGISTA